MKELSILIPARREEFLKQTVEDLLKNIEADTEINVVLDGSWAETPLEQHPRLNVIYVNSPIGQRGATNLACKLSKAKYVMKVDAHCSFDKGFDRKMIEFFKKVGDDVTAVPLMRNLWAFDWKCFHCGWKTYQGAKPEKCKNCGRGNRIRKKIVWIAKTNPQSSTYCFDPEPHFRYFNEFKRNESYIADKRDKGYTETMSLQGSFFMLTREKYWELNICDESLGSWGNQGVEVTCKTWLSGGRVLVNHDTWYAHLFRTQSGFSFPWGQNENEVQKTKKNVKDLFWEKKWDKQKYSVKWLVQKFMPVRGWDQNSLDSLKD